MSRLQITRGTSSTPFWRFAIAASRVLPPIGKQSRYPALSLTVKHAREGGEPVDRKRIEWKLITDLSVAPRREAIEKLNWYAMR